MIEFKNIANAGVCLTIDDKKILIDALHNEKEDIFSVVPFDILLNMYSNTGDYKDSNLILITHSHFDHFSAEVVCKYLDANKVNAVFMPFQPYQKILGYNKKDYENIFVLEDIFYNKVFAKKIDNENENIFNNLIQNKFLELFNKSVGNINFFYNQLESMNFDDDFLIYEDEVLKINAFYTGHMGKKYENIVNFIYIIYLKKYNKNILFTGDSDYNYSVYKKISKRKIDVAFINPLFISEDRGFDILKNILNIDTIIIHHIPFKKDDNGIVRNFVRNLKKNYEEDFNKLILFENEEDFYRI